LCLFFFTCKSLFKHFKLHILNIFCYHIFPNAGNKRKQNATEKSNNQVMHSKNGTLKLFIIDRSFIVILSLPPPKLQPVLDSTPRWDFLSPFTIYKAKLQLLYYFVYALTCLWKVLNESKTQLSLTATILFVIISYNNLFTWD
jgi:hypothetical protein